MIKQFSAAVQAKRSHKKSRLTPQLKLLFSLICALLPLILAFILLSAEDALSFARWSAAALCPALALFPLCSGLFGSADDRGWLYSFALGPLLGSFLFWTAAHTGLPVFTGLFIRLSMILITVLTLGFRFYLTRSKRKISSHSQTLQLSQLLMESALFLALLLLAAYVRSFKPEAYGLEKLMDYGYMMSLWRSKSLPAADIWLAGHSINYYYFGQFFYTFIAKFADVPPATAYNLSIAHSLALTFVLAFALVRDLLKRSRLIRQAASTHFKKYLPSLGAGLSASLLVFGGNSHAFFYADARAGNSFVRLLKLLGLKTGQIGAYFFSDSTRFIGYNPETQDKTIHEFPYYSYLVADLHAHMINLSFVLLFLALLFFFYRRLSVFYRSQPAKSPTLSSLTRFSALKSTGLLFLLLAFLLGIFQMTNYWDFVIYFVILLIVLYAALMRQAPPLSASLFNRFKQLCAPLLQLLLLFTAYLLPLPAFPQFLLLSLATVLNLWLSSRLKNSASSVAVSLSAAAFTLAHGFALPFALNFVPMTKSIRLSTAHSSAYQLFILWFTHLLFGLLFLLFILFKIMKTTSSKQPASFLRKCLGACRSEIFLGILICCAVGLIAAPEFIYIKDIYEGVFSRANTMFKFTYQAFALLCLPIGYQVAALGAHLLPRPQNTALIEPTRSGASTQIKFTIPRNALSPSTAKGAIGILLFFSLLLLGIPFSYTREWQNWYGPLKQSDQEGLDALRYYGTLSIEQADGSYAPLSDRLALIDYLNREEKDQVYIVEAYGESYSDYCSVSAYTGLPTVLGWQTHEWLWRTSDSSRNALLDTILPLQEKIRSFYEAPDLQTAQAFITQYKLSYIVIGELERKAFPKLNESLLIGLGKIAYRSGDNYLIKLQ